MKQTADHTAYSGHTELHLMETCAHRYNRHIVNIFKAELHDKGKYHIVDFGAGIGTLSLIYQTICAPVQTDHRIACVEIDSQNQRELNTRNFSTYTQLDQIPGPIDGIFSSNVLEHIADDRQILKDFYDRLCAGGRMVLYLPAWPVLYSDMDEIFGHYRRYEKGDIVEKCAAAGLRVERIFYCDFMGFLASFGLKIFGYNKLVNAKSLRFYDQYIFPLSLFFDSLGMRNFLGKNIVVVAEKPSR